MSHTEHHKHDDLIEVIVKSQKGKFEGKFAKTDTVQTVITTASTKLGFDHADRFELALEKDRSKPLDPSVLLGSLVDREHEHKEEHKHRLVFILTATGSGV